MRHLTPDELIDAVEESIAHGADARTSILRGVPRAGRRSSRRRLRDRAAGRDARAVPALLGSISRIACGQAIAADPERRRGAARGRDGPCSCRLPALASSCVALVVRSSAATGSSDEAARHARSHAEGAPDSAWAFSRNRSDHSMSRRRSEAGIAASPGSGRTSGLLDLTAAEQEELVRLLQQELAAAGRIEVTLDAVGVGFCSWPCWSPCAPARTSPSPIRTKACQGAARGHAARPGAAALRRDAGHASAGSAVAHRAAICAVPDAATRASGYAPA